MKRKLITVFILLFSLLFSSFSSVAYAETIAALTFIDYPSTSGYLSSTMVNPFNASLSGKLKLQAGFYMTGISQTLFNTYVGYMQSQYPIVQNCTFGFASGDVDSQSNYIKIPCNVSLTGRTDYYSDSSTGYVWFWFSYDFSDIDITSLYSTDMFSNSYSSVFQLKFPFGYFYDAQLFGDTTRRFILGDTFVYNNPTDNFLRFSFSTIDGYNIYTVKQITISSLSVLCSNSLPLLSSWAVADTLTDKYPMSLSINGQSDFSSYTNTQGWTKSALYTLSDLTRINSFSFAVFPDFNSVDYKTYFNNSVSSTNEPFVLDFYVRGFNFWVDTSDTLLPGVGGNIQNYQQCNWYDIPCHLGNALLYFLYEFPLTKGLYTLFSSVGSFLTETFDFLNAFSSVGLVFSFVLVFLVFSFIKNLLR